jgi:nucleotide-binding universal stress UspA family protein
MGQQIVVPLDGSARDAEALATARSLATHLGASLLLVHVEPTLASLARIVADDHLLVQQTAALAAEGFDAHCLIDFGRPTTDIARAALPQRDLIVLTPHHHRLLEALRHPSVTRGLLARAATPLFILPESTTGQSSVEVLSDPDALVIVPLDGSELAEQALPLAVQFAQTYGRPLLLVRVVPTVFMTSVGPDTMRLRHEWQLSEDVAARDYLASTCAQLKEESDLDAQSLRLHGDPADLLARVTGEYPGSLMVMSTHGRGGLARAMLGSVAAEVVRRSAIPLVVVPPDIR